MDNLNVLVEAKKEYLEQLCLIMCPPMIKVFDEMYREAVKISKGRKTLIMFQKLLKEVPNWSNAMSKQHTDNITDRCAWFNDLLAAVFVACTKILSAVRLKADNKKISLKLPTNEIFIQTCYNNIAKDLYKDPYIFHNEQSEYTRDESLTSRFCIAIEYTVKELIPVQQILQTYMSQESRDIDLDGEIEDTVDPDVIDEPEFSMEEPEEEPAPVEELAPPTETDIANEFKTVPGVQAPSAPEEQEPEPMNEFGTQPEEQEQEPEPVGEFGGEVQGGVLFDDAPEQRTKNPRYN
jgi:hypothetical protein